MPRLCVEYPGICLTTEKKSWKNLSQGLVKEFLHELSSIFCGVVYCGIYIILAVENTSDLPQRVIIAIHSVRWILDIFEVKHFHYMHKLMMFHYSFG